MSKTHRTYQVHEVPPWHLLAMLTVQYAFLICSFLVIVVILGRDVAKVPGDMLQLMLSSGLIALGIGTVLQALPKGPIGSGYFAPPITTVVYLQPVIYAIAVGGLPLAFGMLIFAGVMEMILSRLGRLLRWLFPPAVTGMVMVLIGIELGIISVHKILGVDVWGSLTYSRQLIAAVVTLAVTIVASIWFTGTIRLMAAWIGIATGAILSVVLNILSVPGLKMLADAPWVAFPNFGLLSYSFSFKLVLPFLLAAIACTLRVIGSLATCQRKATEDWARLDMKPIRKGILADGASCALAGLLGSIGISLSASILGINHATGVLSRCIAFTTAGVLIVLAFIPKLTALLLVVPTSVVSAVLLFASAFFLLSGFELMLSRNMDTRGTVVIGVSFMLALSRWVYPGFYAKLPGWLQPFTSSGFSIGMIIAVVLTVIFRVGIHRRAVLSLDGKVMSHDALNSLISSLDQELPLPPATHERIRTSTFQIINHLRELEVAEGPITLKASYDQVKVTIHLSYIGDALVFPLEGRHKKYLIEEEVFSSGLADFLNKVVPDRYESYQKGLEAHINLQFYA